MRCRGGRGAMSHLPVTTVSLSSRETACRTPCRTLCRRPRLFSRRRKSSTRSCLRPWRLCTHRVHIVYTETDGACGMAYVDCFLSEPPVGDVVLGFQRHCRAWNEYLLRLSAHVATDKTNEKRITGRYRQANIVDGWYCTYGHMLKVEYRGACEPLHADV
jgi:hypothetical protein